jgi:hypothetical protein
MNGKVLVFVALLPFFFASAVAAAPPFSEGLWEITATMEIPGLDPGLAQPHVYRQCLTGTDHIPREPERAHQCRLLHANLEGDALSWSVHCRLDGGAMDGRGRVLFQREALRGILKGTVRGKEGKTLAVTQRITGRRIGPCPERAEDPRRSGPQHP